MKNYLGIDIGGSGIKAAIVKTDDGELLSERKRLPTPKPSNPENVSNTVKELVDSFNYDGTIGVSFPTVVQNGRAITYGNIAEDWVGTQIDKLFSAATGHNYLVANDADLAGMCEMQLGAGKGFDGMVIMVTIGTGLGTGIFYNGTLVPNIELGRALGRNGEPIEFSSGDKARKVNQLSWEEWGLRFNFFLNHIKRVFTPDHFILGGGSSKKFHKFEKYLNVDVPIHIAQFGNNAGIVGAALLAAGKENN